MAGVRRAFVWATFGQYVVTAITFGGTVVLSRLLTPTEYGAAILGAALIAFAEAIRALGGGAYLIQNPSLTPDAIRTSFTVNALVSLTLAAALAGISGPLSAAVEMPDLGCYLRIALLGYLAGPLFQPISAMLSRRMVFAPLAYSMILAAVVDAGVAIALALSGFGTMSLAWADAAAPLAATVFYLAIWRDWSIFRPSLRSWRGVIVFGAQDCAIATLARLGEATPLFLLGRALNPAAVALCQRAVLLCQTPERIILAGVGAVALSSFAQKAREGRSLNEDYLRSLELLTAAQWPCLISLALLADPIVAMLLGPRWIEVGPLVSILATALLISFPVSMSYATLVAAGAIRSIPPVLLLQTVVLLSDVALTAPGGLRRTMLSLLIVLPLNSMASVVLVKQVVGFPWSDYVRAVRRSAVCAALSAVGPLAIRFGLAGHETMSTGLAILAAGLAFTGWFAGLALCRHPLLHELCRAITALRRKTSYPA